MQLQPRYGTEPIIVLDGPPSEIAAPAARQRRRLADTLASFSDEQWAHPSRCEGWSNRDVIAHLDSTNGFWSLSVAQGRAGQPTQFLESFDPVASPATLVESSSELSAAEVFDRFTASNDALIDVFSSLPDNDWSLTAEAPPGHVSISSVAHHALWDSWVHERDILLPMGSTPEEEDDEIVACLRYAAALSPAFAATYSSGRSGTLAIEADNPDLSIVVDIGDQVSVSSGPSNADFTLTGDAVELLEALSMRGPLNQPIPEDAAWMLNGLAKVFDVEVT